MDAFAIAYHIESEIYYNANFVMRQDLLFLVPIGFFIKNIVQNLLIYIIIIKECLYDQEWMEAIQVKYTKDWRNE